MDPDRRPEGTPALLADREIHLEDRLFRSLFENGRTGLALLDEGRALLRVNPALAQLLEAAEPEWRGRRIESFVHPADGGSLEAILTRGSGTREGFRLRRRNGSWRRVTGTATNFRDARGSVGRVLEIVEEEAQDSGDVSDLRRLESEAKVRLFMDAARDYAIVLFDPSGSVATWSQGAERVLGYREEEALGLHSGSFFVPEDIARGEHLKELDQARIGGRAEDERWHVRKDGSRFFASGVMTAIRDGRGRLVGFCKVMRDITERMLAQQALRQSQEYFSALVNSIDGIVWEAGGPLRRHTFVSRKAEALLGHPIDRWLGRFWDELVYEADRAELRRCWERAFEEKRGYTLDFRLLDAQGRRRWFRDYANAVEPPGGEVTLRAVLVEVTAQKAVEGRQEMLLEIAGILAGSTSLAKAAAAMLPVLGRGLDWDAAVLWTLDPKERVLAPLQVWGVDPARLVGGPRDLPSPDRDARHDPAARAVATRAPVWVEDLAAVPAEERPSQVARAADLGLRTALACPVFLGEEVLGVLELFSDLARPEDAAVTAAAAAVASQLALFGERVRTEEALWNSQEQLRQSQKMEAIGRLAGGVAHDFNNLLTAINGFCDLLLARHGPESPDHAYLEETRKAGRRAASLTHQLLAYSRKQVLAPKVLDLNAVLADMGGMLTRLLGEDIRLEIRPASGPALVKMDPGQLEQVIMNLAVNARDAMPDGGSLVLAAAGSRDGGISAPERRPRNGGEYVRLSVTDTGRGMDEAVKARLFEPFFTTKEAGKGTGLGLSMVYAIVQQTGGSIEVRSEPGRGTTFHLHLPAAREAVPRAPEAGPAAPADRSARETILLVEDEEGVRTLAREILAARGYRVLAARDGEEALRLEASHPGPVDLLLTDFIMPGRNGREVYEAVSSRRPGIRVLYMSGYTEDAMMRHGIAASGSAFLQKPFTPAALVDKVHGVLQGARPASG